MREETAEKISHALNSIAEQYSSQETAPKTRWTKVVALAAAFGTLLAVPTALDTLFFSRLEKSAKKRADNAIVAAERREKTRLDYEKKSSKLEFEYRDYGQRLQSKKSELTELLGETSNQRAQLMMLQTAANLVGFQLASMSRTCFCSSNHHRSRYCTRSELA